MYYVVPDVDQNSEGANRGIATLSQEEYCKNNVDANECGNCNTKARECEETQYLDGCGVKGSSGECSDCTCPDGEYKLGCGGLQEGVCEPCDAFDCVEGEYLIGCSGKEPGGCQQCPDNMTSPSGSNSVEACQCEEGYSGPDGGPCTACLAGTYKDSIGDGYCQACEEGTYQNLPGQSECDDCPTNMTSPNGSDSEDNCVCDKGYEYIDRECRECPTGKYKNTIGNDDTCTPCAGLRPASGKYYHNCGGDSKGTLTDCAYNSCETDEYLYGCWKSNSGNCRKCNTAYISEGPTYGRTHYYPSCGDGRLDQARECSEYSRWNNCSNNQYFWGCFGVNDGDCYSCADRCSQGEVALGCGNGNMGRCESCSDREEDYCSDRSDGRTTLYNCGGNTVGYCGCPDGMYWAWRAGVCRWRN
jgi:hypothetical protein